MTVSVIKLDISKKKHSNQLYIYVFAQKIDLQKLVPFKFWVLSCKMGVPPHTVIVIQRVV